MSKLSQELIDFLQGERIVSLITLDKESGQPIVATISWLIAHQDGKTIKLATGHNAHSIDNINANPNVVLNVIGPESSYVISGTAEASDVKEGTMKFRVVTINVEAVEDNMFYGGKVTTVPAYIKTYNEELAKKLDNEIYSELKK